MKGSVMKYLNSGTITWKMSDPHLACMNCRETATRLARIEIEPEHVVTLPLCRLCDMVASRDPEWLVNELTK